MKIGIIGSSSISEKFCHATSELIDSGQDIDLYANYSRTMERAIEFAQKFGIKNSYDNKVEMMQHIDLVYIASPNKLHFADAKLALQNNTHVLIEKPMTTTKEQTKQLFDLAKQNNLVIVEAIKTCSMNTYQHIMDNLPLIGPITSFRFNMMRSYDHFPQIGQEQIANVFRKDMKGGVINDLSSYALFPLIDFIYPNIYAHKILFRSIILNYGRGIDCEAIVKVNAHNQKAHGLITISMHSQEKSLSYIYGTSGYLTIDSISQFNQIRYYDLDHNLTLVVNREDRHLMSCELQHTIDLIETNTFESNIHSHSKSILVANLIEKLHGN